MMSGEVGIESSGTGRVEGATPSPAPNYAGLWIRLAAKATDAAGGSVIPGTKPPT
jgi:hypothetical protein